MTNSRDPEHGSTAVLDLPDHPPTRAKKKPDWIKRSFFIVLALILAVLLAVGVYALVLANAFNQADTIEDPFPEGERPVAVEGAQTLLLLGSDTRGSLEAGDSGLADTIMVVFIPADREQITVMSIMRDNWVDIPDYGEAKINAAMSTGGVSRMIETVESIIDVPIDHVAIIDFEGFKGATTALGGVTVDNPQEFTAVSGEHFAAGEITLEGDDALAFVRERMAFPTGDYQRAANQQLFMKSLLDEILSADTLANPARTTELVSSIAKYLEVDEGFNATYIAGLGLSLTNIRGDDIRFMTMPTLGTDTINGQSVVLPDWDEIAKIQEAVKNGTLDEYEPPE